MTPAPFPTVMGHATLYIWVGSISYGSTQQRTFIILVLRMILLIIICNLAPQVIFGTMVIPLGKAILRIHYPDYELVRGNDAAVGAVGGSLCAFLFIPFYAVYGLFAAAACWGPIYKERWAFINTVEAVISFIFGPLCGVFGALLMHKSVGHAAAAGAVGGVVVSTLYWIVLVVLVNFKSIIKHIFSGTSNNSMYYQVPPNNV